MGQSIVWLDGVLVILSAGWLVVVLIGRFVGYHENKISFPLHLRFL